jgi:hypothetical protein
MNTPLQAQPVSGQRAAKSPGKSERSQGNGSSDGAADRGHTAARRAPPRATTRLIRKASAARSGCTAAAQLEQLHQLVEGIQWGANRRAAGEGASRLPGGNRQGAALQGAKASATVACRGETKQKRGLGAHYPAASTLATRSRTPQPRAVIARRPSERVASLAATPQSTAGIERSSHLLRRGRLPQDVETSVETSAQFIEHRLLANLQHLRLLRCQGVSGRGD